MASGEKGSPALAVNWLQGEPVSMLIGGCLTRNDRHLRLLAAVANVVCYFCAIITVV